MPPTTAMPIGRRFRRRRRNRWRWKDRQWSEASSWIGRVPQQARFDDGAEGAGTQRAALIRKFNEQDAFLVTSSELA